MDDEKALLPLLERYLRKQGYEPVCFTSAVAALTAFREADQPFDLLMTDLTLEGLSGEELAREVMTLDEKIRVVVMSGYPYSTEQFSDEQRPRVTFLQKPFLPAQFREAVERLQPPPAETIAAPTEAPLPGEAASDQP